MNVVRVSFLLCLLFSKFSIAAAIGDTTLSAERARDPLFTLHVTNLLFLIDVRQRDYRLFSQFDEFVKPSLLTFAVTGDLIMGPSPTMLENLAEARSAADKFIFGTTNLLGTELASKAAKQVRLAAKQTNRCADATSLTQKLCSIEQALRTEETMRYAAIIASWQHQLNHLKEFYRITDEIVAKHRNDNARKHAERLLTKKELRPLIGYSFRDWNFAPFEIQKSPRSVNKFFVAMLQRLASQTGLEEEFKCFVEKLQLQDLAASIDPSVDAIDQLRIDLASEAFELGLKLAKEAPLDITNDSDAISEPLPKDEERSVVEVLNEWHSYCIFIDVLNSWNSSDKKIYVRPLPLDTYRHAHRYINWKINRVLAKKLMRYREEFSRLNADVKMANVIGSNQFAFDALLDIRNIVHRANNVYFKHWRLTWPSVKTTFRDTVLRVNMNLGSAVTPDDLRFVASLCNALELNSEYQNFIAHPEIRKHLPMIQDGQDLWASLEANLPRYVCDYGVTLPVVDEVLKAEEPW